VPLLISRRRATDRRCRSGRICAERWLQPSRSRWPRWLRA